MKVERAAGGGLRRSKKAVSPAISMVVITAVTVVLVLVAGAYAYQVLERQRGASELEAVKKSFITFDDAVRDVAWDKSGVRSTRFTVKYGLLEVVSDSAVEGLPINVTVDEFPNANYSGYTGYLRYNLSTYYVTFGDGYKSYIFGDEKTVISKSTENFGVALIEQSSNRVSLALYYRVRAMTTSVVNVNGMNVSYVEILIIKITATNWSAYTGDFDLLAKSMNVTTKPYFVSLPRPECHVSVSLGESTSSMPLSLKSNDVVFNFVIAEVKVGT